MREINKTESLLYQTHIDFLKIDERAIIPKYAHVGDMCMDISILVDDSNNKPMVMDDSVHAPEAVAEKVIVNKLGNLKLCNIGTGADISVPHRAQMCYS